MGILVSENYDVLASGATLTKSASGPVLTFTGRGDQALSLVVEGNSGTYSGDNIEVTNSDTAFFGVTSQQAAGRALKGTGARTQIFGGVWQTNDATTSGYDLEFSESGNDYNVVVGMGSSQSTGGILMGDGANAAILGSQFGKLTAVGSTGGVGRIVANRITGDVRIEKAFAQLDMNALGAVDVVFGDGSIALSDLYYGPGNVISNGSTFEIKAGVQESRFWLHQVYQAAITPVFGTGVLVNNDIWHGRIAYSSAAFGAAGGSPSIGAGAIAGQYSRAGKEVFVDAQVSFGTGANFGSGFLYVTLPFKSAFRAFGNGMATIGGTSYLFSLQVTPGDNRAVLFNVSSPAGLASAASPAAWGSGDDLSFQIAYTLQP